VSIKIIDNKGRVKGRLFRCNLIDLVIIILALGYFVLCFSWGIESLRGKDWRTNVERNEYTRGWSDNGMSKKFNP